MKQKIFEILDFCNREGMDNSTIGFCQDVDTCNYFGANEEEFKNLDGHWLYIYYEPNNHKIKFKPDIIINVDEEFIYLYKLD